MAETLNSVGSSGSPSSKKPLPGAVSEDHREHDFTLVKGKKINVGGKVEENGLDDGREDVSQFALKVEMDLSGWRAEMLRGTITQSHYDNIERIALGILEAHTRELAALEEKFRYYRAEVKNDLATLRKQSQLEKKFKGKADAIADEWLSTRADANRAAEKDVASLREESLKNQNDDDDVLMGFDSKKGGNYPIDVATFELRMRSDDPKNFDSLAFAEYLAWVAQRPDRQDRMHRALKSGHGKELAFLWGIKTTSLTGGLNETKSMKLLRKSVAAKYGVDAQKTITMAQEAIASVIHESLADENVKKKLQESIRKHLWKNATDERAGKMVDLIVAAKTPAQLAKAFDQANIHRMAGRVLSNPELEKFLDEFYDIASKNELQKYQERAKENIDFFYKHLETAVVEDLFLKRDEKGKSVGELDAETLKLLQDLGIGKDEILRKCAPEKSLALIEFLRKKGKFDAAALVIEARNIHKDEEEGQKNAAMGKCAGATASLIEIHDQCHQCEEEAERTRDPEKIAQAAEARKNLEQAETAANGAFHAEHKEADAKDTMAVMAVRAGQAGSVGEFLAKVENDPSIVKNILGTLEEKEKRGEKLSKEERRMAGALRELEVAKIDTRKAQAEAAQAIVEVTGSLGIETPAWAVRTLREEEPLRDAQAAKAAQDTMEKMEPSVRKELLDLAPQNSWHVDAQGKLVADLGSFTVRPDEGGNTVTAKAKDGLAEVSFDAKTPRKNIDETFRAMADLHFSRYSTLQFGQLVQAWNKTFGINQRIDLSDGLTNAGANRVDLEALTSLSELAHFGTITRDGSTPERRAERLKTTPWTKIEGRLNRMPRDERFYDRGNLNYETLVTYFSDKHQADKASNKKENERRSEAENALSGLAA